MDELIKALTMAIISLLPTWKNTQGEALANEYASVIIDESKSVQPEMDPYLVTSIIFRESSFRKKIRGKRGEYGLMQIKPGTFTRGLPSDELLNVRTNIRVGIGQLHHWRITCGPDQDVWVSAFNIGKCKKTSYSRQVNKVYCRIKPGGCGGTS